MEKFVLSPYPNRIEVLGADFGYVTDYRYSVTDSGFFKAVHDFEKQVFGKEGPGKISVKNIEIIEHNDEKYIKCTLWETNDTFSYTFPENCLTFTKVSGGGNLHNIMRNWDEILDIIKERVTNLPKINFYAVPDTDPEIFRPFKHITFHPIKGENREAYIFINPKTNDTVSFIIPRAQLQTDHHIESELPEEACYFIVGNQPYTTVGHLEFIINHLKRYPASKIFNLPSTTQIHMGYENVKEFIEKVYAFSCNLHEAQTFLHIKEPVIDPEESAEKAANILHSLGIKRVVITHGKHGMFCSVRNTSILPICENWDPIIDIRALIGEAPEELHYVDDKKKIRIEDIENLDVTGCGDAFTSGVFLYDLLFQNEIACNELHLAKYLAALKSIYPYSNLCGINGKLLKFVLGYIKF